jgi:hypothetical protein
LTLTGSFRFATPTYTHTHISKYICRLTCAAYSDNASCGELGVEKEKENDLACYFFAVFIEDGVTHIRLHQKRRAEEFVYNQPRPSSHLHDNKKAKLT